MLKKSVPTAHTPALYTFPFNFPWPISLDLGNGGMNECMKMNEQSKGLPTNQSVKPPNIILPTVPHPRLLLSFVAVSHTVTTHTHTALQLLLCPLLPQNAHHPLSKGWKRQGQELRTCHFSFSQKVPLGRESGTAAHNELFAAWLTAAMADNRTVHHASIIVPAGHI